MAAGGGVTIDHAPPVEYSLEKFGRLIDDLTKDWAQAALPGVFAEVMQVIYVCFAIWMVFQFISIMFGWSGQPLKEFGKNVFIAVFLLGFVGNLPEYNRFVVGMINALDGWLANTFAHVFTHGLDNPIAEFQATSTWGVIQAVFSYALDRAVAIWKIDTGHVIFGHGGFIYDIFLLVLMALCILSIIIVISGALCLYIVNKLVLVILIVFGPVAICMGMIPQTRSMALGWLKTVVSVLLTFLFITIGISLLANLVGPILQEIGNQLSVGASNVEGLLSKLLQLCALFVLVAYSVNKLFDYLPMLARNIGGSFSAPGSTGGSIGAVAGGAIAGAATGIAAGGWKGLALGVGGAIGGALRGTGGLGQTAADIGKGIGLGTFGAAATGYGVTRMATATANGMAKTAKEVGGLMKASKAQRQANASQNAALVSGMTGGGAGLGAGSGGSGDSGGDPGSGGSGSSSSSSSLTAGIAQAGSALKGSKGGDDQSSLSGKGADSSTGGSGSSGSSSSGGGKTVSGSGNGGPPKPWDMKMMDAAIAGTQKAIQASKDGIQAVKEHPVKAPLVGAAKGVGAVARGAVNAAAAVDRFPDMRMDNIRSQLHNAGQKTVAPGEAPNLTNQKAANILARGAGSVLENAAATLTGNMYGNRRSQERFGEAAGIIRHGQDKSSDVQPFNHSAPASGSGGSTGSGSSHKSSSGSEKSGLGAYGNSDFVKSDL